MARTDRVRKETVVLYETTLTRQVADSYRYLGWWRDRLLNDGVAEAVAQYPGRTALVDARGRITYATLQERADHCALALLVHGIRKGDVVTAQLPQLERVCHLDPGS